MTILGRVESIQVGRPRRYDDGDHSAKPWTSAIDKAPVAGSVMVGPTSLAGDEQADLEHHGGPDKSVLGYAAAHYDDWQTEFPDAPFAPGGFGENLTFSGFAEADCCVGDTVQIGDCRLQVSQPRQPCWKLSRRWGLAKLAVRVQQTGRTGWYYRVAREGLIEAGQEVRLVERPFPEFTVAWASAVMYAKPRSASDDLRLAGCPLLSASWKETLTQRATKKIEADPALRLEGK
ncbi:6-N-hydroxylaminopurine resistance protein [Pseudobythopirellula maris]|uniref:6-N-hydroxylaminopurine resistance protein n=1 Tax=Pseudobythopirellula maris TaxID=2527991 RepID=A0A5C5ZUR1_9BACT|nr:MOSC domain-containing protein [Pseudobythopirellula maris]TWT91149.1 6-N-hydroxylaminopurine resistance protein [Pseudobythopirellula maris]